MNEYDKVASYSEQLTVLDEISKYLIELFIKKMRKIIQKSKMRPKNGFGPQNINLKQIFLLLSPSGDLGIGLVWDNNRTTGPLFGPTVEILFKLN